MLLKKTPALADGKADEHVAAAAALIRGIPCVSSASGGRAVDGARAQGFTHAVVVRLRTAEDLPVFTKHALNKRAVKRHISPVVGPGSIEEKYSRMIKMDVRCDVPNTADDNRGTSGAGTGFFAGLLFSVALVAAYGMYKDGKIKFRLPSMR